MKRKCKYCGSEMDLMEQEVNYETHICMNENCRAELTIKEDFNSDYWEMWEKGE